MTALFARQKYRTLIILQTALIAALLLIPAMSDCREMTKSGDQDQPAAKDGDGTGTTNEMTWQRCSVLFGSEADMMNNKNNRKNSLISFSGKKNQYTIMHQTRNWQVPILLQIPGLKLSQIIDSGDQSYAQIKISNKVAKKHGCPAGIYKIKQDGKLLPNLKVLAISNNLMLLQYKGKLGYLPLNQETNPTFRMVWQSPWQIAREEEGGSSGGGSSPTSSAPSKPAKRSRKARSK